jgi:glycosyltransferase involved in cell wall biosynthesis
MLITVAICTLNRAESLRRTLDSLAAMQVPKDLDWEVVVVNNGSTDHTDIVIEAFAERLPIRREFELQRGHSSARNRALDAATGDYIVWTDDDVVVDHGWLSAYFEAFCRWPEAAVFGGPIIPKFETPAVKWIARTVGSEALLGGPYAVRDFGGEVLPLSVADWRVPYGPSYAVRTRDHRNFRYDLNLGRRGGQSRNSEETDVITRMLLSGATGYWLPQARVKHCIGRDRQTVRHLAREYRSTGDAHVYLQQRNGEPYKGPLLFGAPRWMWRQMAEEWLRYWVHRLMSPAPVWLPHLYRYAYVWGQIRYWRSKRG